jgi:glycosyltransferase involved in cell wall biosynthesis
VTILVVHEHYPPHHHCGYDLGCLDAVAELRARGHRVVVLASRAVRRAAARPGGAGEAPYRLGPRRTEGEVLRWLLPVSVHDLPPRGRLLRCLWVLGRRDWVNQRALRRLVRRLRPDVALFYRAAELGYGLSGVCRDVGLPSACYLWGLWQMPHNVARDPWEEIWAPRDDQPPGRFARLKRRVAALLARCGVRVGRLPDVGLPLYGSEWLRRQYLAGRPDLPPGRVVLWGLRPAEWPCRRPQGPPRRLLYVGRLVASKGVHTIIEALAQLRREGDGRELRLAIYGEGPEPYVAELRALVRSSGLESEVEFGGFVAREELPAVYGAHDVLLVPSIAPEAFGLVILEGMATGLLVIASGTGGSGEIVTDGETGLLAAPDDPAAWAAAIRRVTAEPELYHRICRAAREAVERDYDLRRAVAEVEAELMALRRPAGGSP